MSDEVSLFALMDSHLSRTRLDDGNNPSRSNSDKLLPTPPGPRLVIPNFFPGNSPMKAFLAEQISNTFKAKEKKKQEEEEQRKMEEGIQSLKIKETNFSTIDGLAKMKLHDDQAYVIDLTPAIIQHGQSNDTKVQPVVPVDVPSKSQRSKVGQSQLLPDLPLQWDKETCLFKPMDPNLPCITDISNILKHKIKRGKCSSFGKVLCSRVRPIRHIAMPYKIEKYKSNIVRFDCLTKSPGDIYRENQRKPKMSTRWTVDILDYI